MIGNFFRVMRERFGDFYTYGLPGLGQGTHGTVYGKSVVGTGTLIC